MHLKELLKLACEMDAGNTPEIADQIEKGLMSKIAQQPRPVQPNPQPPSSGQPGAPPAPPPGPNPPAPPQSLYTPETQQFLQGCSVNPPYSMDLARGIIFENMQGVGNVPAYYFEENKTPQTTPPAQGSAPPPQGAAPAQPGAPSQPGTPADPQAGGLTPPAAARHPNLRVAQGQPEKWGGKKVPRPAGKPGVPAPTQWEPTIKPFYPNGDPDKIYNWPPSEEDLQKWAAQHPNLPPPSRTAQQTAQQPAQQQPGQPPQQKAYVLTPTPGFRILPGDNQGSQNVVRLSDGVVIGIFKRYPRPQGGRGSNMMPMMFGNGAPQQGGFGGYGGRIDPSKLGTNGNYPGYDRSMGDILNQEEFERMMKLYQEKQKQKKQKQTPKKKPQAVTSTPKKRPARPMAKKPGIPAPKKPAVNPKDLDQPAAPGGNNITAIPPRQKKRGINPITNTPQKANQSARKQRLKKQMEIAQ